MAKLRLILIVLFSLAVCSCTGTGGDSNSSNEPSQDAADGGVDAQQDGSHSTHSVMPFVDTWPGEYSVDVVLGDTRLAYDYQEPLVIEEESEGVANVKIRSDAEKTCELAATANADDELVFEDGSCELTVEEGYHAEIDSTEGTIELEEEDYVSLNITATGTFDDQPATIYISFVTLR